MDDLQGSELGESDILVDVNAVPDASATVPLSGMALGGLAFVSRKFRK